MEFGGNECEEMRGSPHFLISPDLSSTHMPKGSNIPSIQDSLYGVQQGVCGIGEVSMYLKISEVLEVHCKISAKWVLLHSEDSSNNIQLAKVINGLVLAREDNLLMEDLFCIQFRGGVIAQLPTPLCC